MPDGASLAPTYPAKGREEPGRWGLVPLILLEAEDEDEDEGKAETPARGDTREVQNYLVALDWALSQLDTLPVSSRLICGIHERLLHGVRGYD